MVKFLVIRFSSIGDIVLTTPVIRMLKQQVDDCEVHYLTKKQYASILEANPYIDKLHLYSGDMNSTLSKLREELFDYVIDLHHNLRTSILKNRLRVLDFSVDKINREKWLLVNFRINRMPDKHMVHRNLDTLKVFDIAEDQKGLDYFIPSVDEVNVSEPGPEYAKGYIALAIGAQHETKKMPVEKLIELVSLLKHPVIILGGPEDKPVSEQICHSLPDHDIYNGSGAFSINQSASLVRQARVVISHDTGMMHIAAAFQKKVISIWGSTDPVFGMYPYRAHPDSFISEVRDLRCRPCSKIGYKKCPKKHFKCMLEQDIKGIAGKAEDLFTVQ